MVTNLSLRLHADAQLDDDMYSDDEPDLGMDYNFRDLNSIHRATGQTVSWIIKA